MKFRSLGKYRKTKKQPFGGCWAVRGAGMVAPGRRGLEGLWKGYLQGRGLDEPGDGLAVEGL